MLGFNGSLATSHSLYVHTVILISLHRYKSTLVYNRTLIFPFLWSAHAYQHLFYHRRWFYWRVLSSFDARVLYTLRVTDTVFLPVPRIMLNVLNHSLFSKCSRLHVCVSGCCWIQPYSQACIFVNSNCSHLLYSPPLQSTILQTTIYKSLQNRSVYDNNKLYKHLVTA